MDSLRKWFYKPRRDDTSHLAQFFYADEALNLVAAELDSFDGRKDPDRCTTLVNHLRQCQDKVLTICNRIMDEMIPNERADRDFRVKFPDDVMQDNLAGQLWFGAECLAAGSSIMNRESESGAMRPLAKALTKALENVRNLLREAALRSVPYCSASALMDHHTEKLVESLKMFDRLLADFELAYVSAMVPVKSVQEYELQQCVVVLFSETLHRALKIGLLTQEMVDQYDPAVMFSIPRLAIVAGLLIYPHGPLSLNSPQNMSDMFRPFRTLLMKIRELLWTLTENELMTLEKMLCSSEETLSPSEGQKVMRDMKSDLDENQEWAADLSEFESGLEKSSVIRQTSDSSSVTSTLTCVDRSFNNVDETAPSDVTPSVGRSLLPHLFFLNQISDDGGTLQSPLSSEFSAAQSSSDNSLSDRSPDLTEPYKGPSTSAGNWTLHVIPCECSYARCLPNCECTSNWTKSSRREVDRTCPNIERSSTSHSDRSGDSNELHRSSIICSSNNNIDSEVLGSDNNFNLNKNFSKEIIDKNLSNLCASEVVLKDYVERTSSVQGESGETSNSINGMYEGNWENLSAMASSNAEDIRRHNMQVEGDGIASSFSSSCSSCQSTVSAISNSVSSDTSSYNSDCRDEMEVALAVKAAELTNNQEARSKFRSSADLVHRLFVCVSGVADQLQTNFAGDLRNILKIVFLIHASDRNDYDTLEDPNNGECCERGEDAVVWGERDVESPPAWVPDQAAPTCMSCQSQFTVVRRRHHCRNCGKVFCARCSSNSVPLPRYGHLKPVRVCNRCYIYQVTPFTIDQNIATVN